MTPEITGYAYRLLTLAQKGPHGMSLLVGQAGVFKHTSDNCSSNQLLSIASGQRSAPLVVLAF